MVPAVYLLFSLSSFLGFAAKKWEQVRIIVLMEIALTVIGFLVGLYEALFADAPVSIWFNTALYAVFAIAWIWIFVIGRKEIAAAE